MYQTLKTNTQINKNKQNITTMCLPKYKELRLSNDVLILVIPIALYLTETQNIGLTNSNTNATAIILKFHLLLCFYS